MTNRMLTRNLISFCLAIAIVCTYSMVGLAAAPQSPSGELVTTGQVTVNGQNALSGATIFTDSTIETARGSSAVVSLGKLGRVELLPDSNLRLSFNESGVTGMLNSGRVRVSSPSGVSIVISTKDGSAASDTSQDDVFIVDVECGNTVVDVQTGRAELRSAGGNRMINAGGQGSIGQPLAGTRCAVTQVVRADDVAAGDFSGAKVAAVLVGVGAVIAAIVLVASQSGGEEVEIPGPGNPSAIQ